MADLDRAALPAVKKLSWMPFYGAAFFGDEAVSEMSNEEIGATLRLFWHQWTNGSLPGERVRLERIAGTRQLDAVLPLFPFLPDRDDRRAHPGLAELYDDQQARHARLAEAGRKGGLARGQAPLEASPERGHPSSLSIREEKKREEKTQQDLPPALAESRSTLERELEAFSPSVLEAIRLWADRSANPASVWASVRRYGPGGTSEFAGVLWADVAVGVDEAASLGREMTPNKVGACIRNAVERRVFGAGDRSAAPASVSGSFQAGLDAIANGRDQ